MDRFATLEPVKLYAQKSTGGLLGRGISKATSTQHLVGCLPADLHIIVLTYLAIPDIPTYARTSRILAELSRDERVWELKWKSLGINADLEKALDEVETRTKSKPSIVPTSANVDDEFGDFTSSVATFGTQDLFSTLPVASLSSHPAALPESAKHTYRQKFIRVHTTLKALLPSLSGSPHLVLPSLFPAPAPPLATQAQVLHLLALFLSPTVRPVRSHENLYASVRAGIDRFQAGLLSAFDAADGRRDEAGMRTAALASWEVWEGRLGGRGAARAREADWELGRVWAEKREVFYEQGRWRPLDNFTAEGALDFSAMDLFIKRVLDALESDGAVAVNIFPKDSYAVLSYADRLATEVIGEYIVPLLTKAREVSNQVFLTATAATFREAWRMVDALLNLNPKEGLPYVSRTQAEDVVYQMFEPNMDEYLDEEVDSVQQAFDAINREWERNSSAQAAINSTNTPTHARFLGSHNPAQVKRTLLASFTDALLLPVTIVPRTVGVVGAALTTGGTAAVQGIAMLNPQRWGMSGATTPGGEYSRKLGDNDGQLVFEIGDDDEDEKEKVDRSSHITRSSVSSVSVASHDTLTVSTAPSSLRSTSPAPSTSTSSSLAARTGASATAFAHLDLHLSLDVALELIHADREALKRVETFAGYPGRCGHRVRDTIEEVFILLLRSVGERHISPGFDRATEQMRTYKPGEHEETTSVAPLMQFFELVHIGDTIQSMVQVYFDKELAPHIDKTDFLNAVVREKKRFENTLDDSVAAGMNAGTDVLMSQVEHIILTRTKAREYYPEEDAPLDLGPTRGCQEAIACLDMHCKLLKGSTSKEVLEVFYQEVGIRLLGILHRHIKRQIISLTGGFQVIADLNFYHAFISSLKVPSIATDFSNLKMLGHVYVVEDAKDLAQIVRDVTRYGGAYRPEDIYEFIQRRADWKKIEKIVDKTMYNLSFKEDCVIC